MAIRRISWRRDSDGGPSLTPDGRRSADELTPHIARAIAIEVGRLNLRDASKFQADGIRSGTFDRGLPVNRVVTRTDMGGRLDASNLWMLIAAACCGELAKRQQLTEDNTG